MIFLSFVAFLKKLQKWQLLNYLGTCACSGNIAIGQLLTRQQLTYEKLVE